MSRLPAHVQTAIETRLGLPLGLAAGYAKGGHCRKCGLAILAGYDAPACAGLAVVDPRRLTPQLEAAAVILGVPTWQLHGRFRLLLSNRTFPGVPPIVEYASADNAVVLAAHRCGFSLGGGYIETAENNHQGWPDEIPF